MVLCCKKSQPVRRRHHGIDRFAFSVTLQAFDVDSLVHLPAFGSDAAKPAAGPGLADRADKELGFMTGVE
jgi:hypothetical protein